MNPAVISKLGLEFFAVIYEKNFEGSRGRKTKHHRLISGRTAAHLKVDEETQRSGQTTVQINVAVKMKVWGRKKHTVFLPVSIFFLSPGGHASSVVAWSQ
ncbi:hypothetical protein AMECASPLE_008798 [Ameca splendens]|uniref:Uncharacterized protein n=1 Tax=Ameca splendens TaxID=208324 RepID=A0ABV0YXY0_9TELE